MGKKSLNSEQIRASLRRRHLNNGESQECLLSFFCDTEINIFVYLIELTGSGHVSNVDRHVFGAPPKGCLVRDELLGVDWGLDWGQRWRSALNRRRTKEVDNNHNIDDDDDDEIEEEGENQKSETRKGKVLKMHEKKEKYYVKERRRRRSENKYTKQKNGDKR